MRGVFVALCLIGAVPAHALASGEDCISVSNDLDRLACYDKALGRTGKTERLPPASKGTWRVQRETSKLTDQPTVVMSQVSKESIDCRWNKSEKITLVVRCLENKTAMYFSTHCHMADRIDGYGRITYRIDDEKARTVEGNASTDSRALGLWAGGKSIPVIKQMLGKSEMIVRMTPFSESSFTATFDITGLDESIKPLRKACNW